ncbi:hypothetical protein C8Q75DRAFT_11960 [Abortiporus biennis]|nr:hypothetical protein C8Q75DRAFT_11960 [Abortiporus biennis]
MTHPRHPNEASLHPAQRASVSCLTTRTSSRLVHPSLTRYLASPVSLSLATTYPSHSKLSSNFAFNRLRRVIFHLHPESIASIHPTTPTIPMGCVCKHFALWCSAFSVFLSLLVSLSVSMHSISLAFNQSHFLLQSCIFRSTSLFHWTLALVHFVLPGSFKLIFCDDDSPLRVDYTTHSQLVYPALVEDSIVPILDRRTPTKVLGSLYHPIHLAYFISSLLWNHTFLFLLTTTIIPSPPQSQPLKRR